MLFIVNIRNLCQECNLLASLSSQFSTIICQLCNGFQNQMTRCKLNLLYIFDNTFFTNKSAYLYQKIPCVTLDSNRHVAISKYESDRDVRETGVSCRLINTAKVLQCR